MVASALATTQPSSAEHNGDDHTPNMSLVATLATGNGGDIAFWGDLAILARMGEIDDLTDDGFTVVEISDPTAPRVVSTFTCTASGFDVSVWRDLVFLSVNKPVQSPECDAPAAEADDDNPFAGIQIVSIEDPSRPVHVAAVPTNIIGSSAGSHTHTLLPDLDHRTSDGRSDPRILVYANGISPLEIIEVPLRRPSEAKVVQRLPTPPYSGCHDVSFFIPRNLGVCSSIQPDTQIWDISDPLKPRVLATIVNPAIEHHHSSAFSFDGNTLVIPEENISNVSTKSCHAGTESPKGALWFYDVTEPRTPVLRRYFQAEQDGPDDAYCTVHQLNVVPLRSGRDILVASWETAGTTVIDFTDPSNPDQIGHYIADPDDPERRSSPWASYWYNGFIYANNSGDGVLGPFPPVGSRRDTLDIFTLDDIEPTDYVRLQSFNFGTHE